MSCPNTSLSHLQPGEESTRWWQAVAMPGPYSCPPHPPAHLSFPLPTCPTHMVMLTREEEEGSRVEALEAGCRNAARWRGDSRSFAGPIGFTLEGSVGVCVRAFWKKGVWSHLRCAGSNQRSGDGGLWEQTDRGEAPELRKRRNEEKVEEEWEGH